MLFLICCLQNRTSSCSAFSSNYYLQTHGIWGSLFWGLWESVVPFAGHWEDLPWWERTAWLVWQQNWSLSGQMAREEAPYQLDAHRAVLQSWQGSPQSLFFRARREAPAISLRCSSSRADDGWRWPAVQQAEERSWDTTQTGSEQNYIHVGQAEQTYQFTGDYHAKFEENYSKCSHGKGEGRVSTVQEHQRW